MSILWKRWTLWVFVLAVVSIVVGGFAGEAAADVYAGTLTFQGLPSANITITVLPGSAT
jgi:hypothetical protein